MKGQVIGSMVLIKPAEVKDKFEGIVMPNKQDEQSYYGTVVQVGTGARLQNGERVQLDVNEGDVVYYTKFSGFELVLDGENYLVIQERDIFYRVPKEEME